MKYKHRIALFILALLSLFTACTVATNLDIVEAIYPEKMAMQVKYNTVTYYSTSTLSLPVINSDSGFYNSISIYNNDTNFPISITKCTLSNTTNFSLATSAFPVEVKPQTSMALQVRYTSSVVGPVVGNLIIEYTIDGRNRTFTIALNGTRVDSVTPIIEVYSPENTLQQSNGTAYNFGYVNSGSIDKTFIIKNAGQEALTISSFSSSNLKFTILSAIPSSSLAANANTLLVVRCVDGTVAGTADITITSDASNVASFILKVASDTKPSPPVIEVYSPENNKQSSNGTAYNYGYVSSGYIDKTFIIKNAGLENLTISSYASSDNTKFTVQSSIPSTPLGLNGSATLVVRCLDGTVAGTADITITSDASNITVFVLKVSSETKPVPPTIAVSSPENDLQASNGTPYNFGYIASGNIDKTFVIKNTGQEDLTLGSISSNNTSAFSIITNPAGAVLASNASTTLVIRCLNAQTSKNADITINSNASNLATFILRVSSDNLPHSDIEVSNPDSAVMIPSADGVVPYDLGYSVSGITPKTFSIKNTGLGDLHIYGITTNSSKITIATAPSAGTAVLPGASITFTVQMSDASAAESATITIVSDALNKTSYSVKVYGGGASISMTYLDEFPYKLSGHGFDFGYNSISANKNITITNTGIVPFTIGASATSAFSYSGSPVTILPSVSGDLSVTYSPVTDVTSESDLILTSTKNRTYTIRVVGTGYKQPTNIGSIALWLRADRIASSDLLGGTDITRLPDVSGRALHAYPPNTNRPLYNASGINTMPSISLQGTESMLVAPVAGEDYIVKDVSGTTTFVVFRTSTLTTRYILSANSSPTATATCFPDLYTAQWYFDPIDGKYYNTPVAGTPTTQFRFNLNGSGMVTPPRCPVDSKDVAVNQYSNYAIGMLYDGSISTTSTNYPPNIKMWINGSSKLLSYLYSLTSDWAVPILDTTNSNPGAFGLPISDQTGKRHSDLGQSDISLTPGSAWNTERKATAPAPKRTYDYGYTFNNYATILQNRVTATPATNGTIKKLYLGISSTGASPFVGEIAEVIVFSKALSDLEIDDINNYIKQKYNILP